MAYSSEYIAQLLGQSALPTESSGVGPWGGYGANINDDQLKQLRKLMGDPVVPYIGYPNLLGVGGYIPIPGTSGGVRVEQAGEDGNYVLSYTPNVEGTNMAMHQSDIAGSKNTDMLGSMFVGGILGAGALGLGGAGTGQYATVSEALAAGDYAAADAMAAAAFDAGGGISGLGSSLGSGAGGLIEGVNAYSYGGQLIPYGDVALNAAPGFSMTTGGYTPSMWDTIKTGASSLFGGGGGGNGAGTAAGVAANAAGGAGGGGTGWGGLLATGAGALLGGVNGSKQTGEQTQSQAPWSPMQPYLLAAGQQAANVYDRARTMPQGTQNALNSAQGVIDQQLSSPLYGQSQNVASGLLSGQMQGVSIPQTFNGMGALDPTAAYQSQLSGQVNPYVDQMAQSITNQVNRNTLENVMPSIRSGAQAAGQYGSSRQGIAEGLAASRAQQDLGSSLSSLYGSAYENAQGRQASAANQLGSMGVNNAQNNNTQRLAQFNTGANLWNQGNNTQNTAVQNALGVANYPSQYQWDQLKNYSGIVNPMAGMGGTTSTPTYTNPWANALGGAITGAQTYKSIFG